MLHPLEFQQKMFADAARREYFLQAQQYAFEYLDSAFDRRVFPDQQALDGLNQFDEPLPSSPTDPQEMLRMLHTFGSPATVATTGGRYFGLVIGSSFTPVMAARWLTDVWDQIATLYVTSPVLAKLEAVCERWLVDLFGLPPQTVAGYVSGTSMATLCGLVAGRYQILQKQGWDVNAQGLFGAPPVRVIVGDEAHSSVFKALALLGLGKERVERVPVDAQGRMLAGKVPPLDERCLVILQAGNVNSGSFDPIDEICDQARAANAWVHIDGAFGLWAAASSRTRHLTHGLQKADSWSVDAHKTLNAPYDSGIILCRDRTVLASALQAGGAYLAFEGPRDGMSYTPEMSRRSRAVELWATLKTIGSQGVEALVDGLCDRALQAASLLRQQGFQVLNDVVFNQVVIACNPPEKTSAILARLQQSGECWCGGSRWHDQPVIRLSVCSWATTPADIERTVAAFVQAREKVS